MSEETDIIYPENVQGPAPKSKTKSVVLLVLCLFAFVCLVYFATKWNSQQSVKDIFVTGNSFVSTEEIKAKVNSVIQNSTNENLKMKKIEAKILENPFIVSVHASRKNSFELNIEILERIPAAIVSDQAGNLNFIDSTGFLLPYRIFPDMEDFIVIRNISNKNKIDSVHCLAVIRVLNALKSVNYSLLYNFISEIVVDTASSNITMITSDDASKIIFGNTEQLNNKLDKLMEFLPGRQVSPGSTPSLIDVRWADQVVLNSNNKTLNTLALK